MTISVTVPDNWTETKITNVALRLYDTLHLIGPRIDYQAWARRFARDASTDNASRRAWERFKKDLRDIGLPFTLDRPHDVLVASNGNPALGQGVESIVIESAALANSYVEALIGKPEWSDEDFEVDTSDCKTIYELHPYWDKATVDAFFESLAESVEE